MVKWECTAITHWFLRQEGVDELPTEQVSRPSIPLTRNMDVQRSKALIAGVAPPGRIDIDDIVVRRWEPVDLTARLEAVTKVILGHASVMAF